MLTHLLSQRMLEGGAVSGTIDILVDALGRRIVMLMKMKEEELAQSMRMMLPLLLNHIPVVLFL